MSADPFFDLGEFAALLNPFGRALHAGAIADRIRGGDFFGMVKIAVRDIYT
jgi:hypothetical protein